MAVEQDTFLFRLITELDDNQAMKEMAQDLTLLGDKSEQARANIANMMNEIKKSAPTNMLQKVQQQLANLKGPTDISSLKAMKDDLLELQNRLEDGSQASQRLEKVISAIDTANFKQLSKHVEGLQGDLQSATTFIDKFEKQLGQIDEQGSLENIDNDLTDVRKSIQLMDSQFEDLDVVPLIRSLNRAEVSVQQLRQAQIEAHASFEQTTGRTLDNVAQKTDNVRLKTNQMSQAILQGTQDAQFGFIGLSNNIQMAAESMTNQMQRKGVSAFRVIKSSITNLLTGPMALATVATAVTLIAQNWSSVKSAAREAINVMTGSAYSEALQNAKNFADAVDNALSIEKPGKEFVSSLKSIKENTQKAENQLVVAYNKALRKQEEARKDLRKFKSTLSSTTATLLEMGEVSQVSEKVAKKFNKLKLQFQDAKAEADFFAQSIRTLRGTEKKHQQLVQEITKTYGDEYGPTIRKVLNLVEKESKDAKEETKDLLSASELLTNTIRKLAEESKNIQFDPFISPDTGKVQEAYSAVGEVIKAEVDKFETELESLKNTILVPEQGFVKKDKWIKQQREAMRVAEKTITRQLQTLQQTKKFGKPEAQSLFGAGLFPTENVMQEQFTFQQRMLKQQKKLQKQRLNALIDFQKARIRAFGENSPQGQLALQRIKSLEAQKARIERRFQEKREQNQKKHLRSQIQNISRAGRHILSTASTVASDWFGVWKTQRKRELKNQGKTAKQRRKILREEGKKRFQIIKKLKIAAAIAEGISAAQSAWSQGMAIGGPPVAAAYTALSVAKTAARIQKLRQLTIGSRLGGMGGGGVGGGASQGSFTQGSASRNARRAANFGQTANTTQTRRQRQRQNELTRAANKVENAAFIIANSKIKYDDETAEDIVQRGTQRAESLNV